MSFCKAVAMLVRLKIWSDKPSILGTDLTRASDAFVAWAGEGVSGSSRGAWVALFCRASIVADCGGVFSPSMLCCGLLTVGRTMGVRLGPGTGVGSSLSAGLDSTASRILAGVEGLAALSDDFVGDCGLCGLPFSRSILRSRTVPVCNDCIRR